MSPPPWLFASWTPNMPFILLLNSSQILLIYGFEVRTLWTVHIDTVGLFQGEGKCPPSFEALLDELSLSLPHNKPLLLRLLSLQLPGGYSPVFCCNHTTYKPPPPRFDTSFLYFNSYATWGCITRANKSISYPLKENHRVTAKLKIKNKDPPGIPLPTHSLPCARCSLHWQSLGL